MVTLKTGVSSSGRAHRNGHGRKPVDHGRPGARRLVHAMRARHDAVMVGGGTARQDDPSLERSATSALPRQPARVVVSRKRLDLPLGLVNLAQYGSGRFPLLLCHGPHRRPARLIQDLARHSGATLFPCRSPARGNSSGHRHDLLAQPRRPRPHPHLLRGRAAALAASLLERWAGRPARGQFYRGRSPSAPTGSRHMSARLGHQTSLAQRPPFHAGLNPSNRPGRPAHLEPNLTFPFQMAKNPGGPGAGPRSVACH